MFSPATSEATSKANADKPILVADPGSAARERIDELTDAFRQVVESGWFILGQQVDALEQSFANWQACEHVIGVANGTDALELCLRSCGIESGDLVIVPTHTAVATATAVVRSGAIPLLLDIDPNTFNLNLDQVEQVLLGSEFAGCIKAMIPVHLYGNPCDMTRLMSLAKQSGLVVIEDCSQGHGAKWDEKQVGNFADAAAMSCYPTKNFAALGDAGLCLTSSEAIAERIRLLRQYGWKERYVSDEVGMNSRLDEVQAALLNVQLRYLDQDTRRRREIADLYRSELNDLPLILPTVDQSAFHVYHQFTILVKASQRDELREQLGSQSISTAVLYPTPIHLQRAYLPFAAQYPLDRSNAESICQRLLCLPMHPHLTDSDVARVIAAVRSFAWEG